MRRNGSEVSARDERIAFSRVGMHISYGCLIVSIQTELYDEVMYQIQRDVLTKISESGVRGLVLDVSMVEIMDSFIAQTFADTARMAAMLGTQTVLAGIRPAVASALTDLGISLTGIHTALTPELALQLLGPMIRPQEYSTDAHEDAEIEQQLDYCTDNVSEVGMEGGTTAVAPTGKSKVFSEREFNDE